MGRFSDLFRLKENLYSNGSPIVVMAGSLLKDNDTGRILAQVKFKNISTKAIKAVKVSINAYDVSNSAVEGIKEYQYLDLNAGRNVEFGQKTAVYLPDENTRSYSVSVASVIFSDNTIWEAPQDCTWSELPKQELLTSVLEKGLVEQYIRETNSDSKYKPIEYQNLWLCSCGGLNHQEEKNCSVCGLGKDKAFSCLDASSLSEQKEKYDSEVQAQKEKRAKEKQSQSAKKKKIILIASPIAAVVIVAIVLITTVFIPQGKYNSAVALMDDGKYAEAILAFKEMGNYKDAEEKLNEVAALQKEEKAEAKAKEMEEDYQKAITLLNNDNYDDAIKAFEKLGDYKDSSDKAKECIYSKAFSIIESSNTSNLEAYYRECESVYLLLSSIGSYQNADKFLASNFRHVRIKASLIWEKGMPTGSNHEEYFTYDEKGNCTYEPQGYGGRMLFTPEILKSPNRKFQYDDYGNVISMRFEGIGDVHTVNYDYGYILIVPD